MSTAVPGVPAHGEESASTWIIRHAPLVPPGARVLDLACGYGRHARWFAGRGCRVLAVDRDRDALASLASVPGVETAAVDLESGGWPLDGQRFDAIVAANYLYRPLFPHLIAALADDGALLYETFARGNEAFGRPSNPAFLLDPGELLRVVAGRLQVVAFEEGRVALPGRDAVIQRIAAVGGRRAWPAVLLPVRPPD
jgi:SAM-dependent methyltransferase